MERLLGLVLHFWNTIITSTERYNSDNLRAIGGRSPGNGRLATELADLYVHFSLACEHVREAACHAERFKVNSALFSELFAHSTALNETLVCFLTFDLNTHLDTGTGTAWNARNLGHAARSSHWLGCGRKPKVIANVVSTWPLLAHGECD